jgi:hypothetical protein
MSASRSRIIHLKTNIHKLLLVAVGCLLPGVIQAQVPEVIPPPTTPNTKISNLNAAVGYVRAKASPDECWTGLGVNQKWAFINQKPGQSPCLPGQVPKVDQGYIWGQTVVGNQIYFGTFANAECIGVANSNSNPTPVYENNSWACEYALSPYATTRGGPFAPSIADDRPPRMYVYDVVLHTIKDITPKLPAAAAPQLCLTTGNDAICTDPLWNTMIGVRSATSYTEPATGKTYVIVSGSGLVNGPTQNAIVFYIWGISENRWVAKYQYIGYLDVRHWLTDQNVLYAAAFKPNQAGGSLLRYSGNLATVPAVGNPQTNAGSTILSCGTSPTNPPAPTGVCIKFDDVGDFDSPASEVIVAPAGTTDAGRYFVGTWSPNGPNAPTGVGGIYMSPVVPAGGLTTANAAQWTKVWNAGNYEPDPVIKTTYGTGQMAFYNGYLYWGTLNPTLSAVSRIFKVYGTPTDPNIIGEDALKANRTAVLFRGQNFSTGTPQIDLLYGQSALPVYSAGNPTANPPVPPSWTLTPTNTPTGSCATACGTPPLFGESGFNNVWTNYMWSMAVINSRLYVGTMNWEYLAAAGLITNNAQLPPLGTPQPSQFGANLYYFADTSTPAIPVSTNGIGNYLNYGVRNIIPFSATMFFLGTANPMGLAAGATANFPGASCSAVGVCRGGWELIEIDPPTSTVIKR